MGAGTWRRMASAAVLALLTLAGVGPAAAQGSARVEGRVTDDFGRPVQGASVMLVADGAGARGGAVLSEQTGGFQFASVPPGSYRLRVEKPGYRAQEEAFTLRGGERRTVVLRLHGERQRRESADRQPVPALPRP
jgi:protocatechuate 3,4-dioxygenase beta subunit